MQTRCLNLLFCPSKCDRWKTFVFDRVWNSTARQVDVFADIEPMISTVVGRILKISFSIVFANPLTYFPFVQMAIMHASSLMAKLVAEKHSQWYVNKLETCA